MRSKKYYFDFFECVTNRASASAEIQPTSEVFRLALERKQSGGSTVKRIAGCNYEFRMIEQTDFGYRGIVGKHRDAELPHVAIVNGEEREIELARNENLLEKSYFHFYADYQVLILQRNRYCLSWINFSKYLSGQGFLVSMNPVLGLEDLEFLMNDNFKVKKVDIKIARPRNPDIFRNVEHDFNNSIISTLRGSGAASITLSLSGIPRSLDPDKRYLGSSLKLAFREMLAMFDVKKCQVVMENEEDHLVHPVDLIANRLVFSRDISVQGRYPVACEIWQALDEARSVRNLELVNYFGELNAERLA